MTSQTDRLAVSGGSPVATAAGDPGRWNHDPAARRIRLRLADLLLPAGVALWAFGVSTTDATTLGPYGLPPVLPTVFWAGVILTLVSAAVELGRDRVSGWRMALHAVALTVMLYGTAPLVYSEGRYSWLYKTIGVVQYVNANGQLNRTIDIYQNWPGFFALAAWFGKVAGVVSPLAYAKWAQLVLELAALPLLYLAYDALSLTTRQRWLALLLYAGTNWIGQDYFSPQGLGTVLSLGIMAIVLRWFYVRTSSAPPGLQAGADRARGKISRFRYPPLLGGALLAVFFVLSFEHELSPYILVVQVGALAVGRVVRPRWLPVLLTVIVVGYLLPRFGYVNSTFGVLNSIGNFFSNARPPALQGGSISTAQRMITHGQEALSLGMWFLAVVGTVLRRRSGRTVAALALLAFSPFIMLVLLAYGQEGVLRVYLFSLPWTAALGALALAPFPRPGKLTAQGTAKPAQALATTLWVPRNGSGGTDDTVILDLKAVNQAVQAAVLARSVVGSDSTTQTSLSPAGSPEAAGGQRRPPTTPVLRLTGSSDFDDTVVFSPGDADRTRQAMIAAGAALGTAVGSNRRFALTRQGWHVMILMCLAATVLIASIIAVAVLGR